MREIENFKNQKNDCLWDINKKELIEKKRQKTVNMNLGKNKQKHSNKTRNEKT